MNEETFLRQRPFAGEAKPSMLRRAVWHDYSGRSMYMVTLVTEGRRPLLGMLAGRSDGAAGTDDEPRCVLSPLGDAVRREWWDTSRHHPEIAVVALQMMPDHLHGILFVKQQMERPVGMAIRGFKQSCNKHYRTWQQVAGAPAAVQYVALSTQHTEQRPTSEPRSALGPSALAPQRDRRGEDRTHGLLFARGYNDRLLLQEGQLDRWLHYLADNPRRLLMKREHPDLFRVQRNVQAAGMTFSAIGNRFLLTRPWLVQVQCSRSLTVQQVSRKVEEMLTAARGGAVLVSPSISPGEKAVMRAAFDEGWPVVFLQENGLTDLAKPGGARMEACSRGQLLILAPWQHHNQRTLISRDQCLSLNEMARRLCQ